MTETTNFAELEKRLPEAEIGRLMDDIRDSLRRLDRRDWWLWAMSVAVMLLLLVAVVSFTWPAVFGEADHYLQININLAVRGLVGMVLLFNLYVVYQQILIKRLRRQMGQQIELMAQLKFRAEEFHRLSTIDPLTGLFNRRLAEQRLTGEINRSERHSYPLTVVVFDLNGFKQVNDTYGHAAGDEILKAFAGRLTSAIRTSDLAVRLGGDEFMAVLPECLPAQLPQLLARLTPLEVSYNGIRLAVTTSAGWAGHERGEAAEHLIERADRILYENKRQQKKSVQPALVSR